MASMFSTTLLFLSIADSPLILGLWPPIKFLVKGKVLYSALLSVLCSLFSVLCSLLSALFCTVTPCREIQWSPPSLWWVGPTWTLYLAADWKMIDSFPPAGRKLPGKYKQLTAIISCKMQSRIAEHKNCVSDFCRFYYTQIGGVFLGFFSKP